MKVCYEYLSGFSEVQNEKDCLCLGKLDLEKTVEAEKNRERVYPHEIERFLIWPARVLVRDNIRFIILIRLDYRTKSVEIINIDMSL